MYIKQVLDDDLPELNFQDNTHAGLNIEVRKELGRKEVTPATPAEPSW